MTTRQSDALVLAVDEGTTNAKAVLVDASTGTVVARGAHPVGITFPAPGWVEQDAEQLWAATLAAVEQCLQAAGDVRPAALAVSNQRESVVAWRRSTGEPVGPVLGWQDARTAAACAALGDDVRGLVRTRTGLSADPMFSAPKMRWLLDAAHAQGVPTDDLAVGTVDAFLVQRFTGTAATEAGNASRTLLLDLTTLDWHPELLEAFGVPASVLPPVCGSDEGFGTTLGHGRLPAGVPLAAVLADSHAALYAHGCTTPGTGKATYGTGSSVMAPVAGRQTAPDGVATTLAWVAGGAPTYAREGNVLASGAALDWAAGLLGIGGGAALSELAAQVPDSGGVDLVPAFAGLGAPTWDRSATGLITGVTGGTTRAHLARAALEAVAHQVADVVEAVESDGRAHVDVLHADGGATASDLLMQLQADLLDRPVLVADAPEASALGAAALAARTLGLPPVASAPGRLVEPTSDPERRGAARARWHQAVLRSRGLAVPTH